MGALPNKGLLLSTEIIPAKDMAIEGDQYPGQPGGCAASFNIQARASHHQQLIPGCCPHIGSLLLEEVGKRANFAKLALSMLARSEYLQ